ncbi:MAG: hypothetical protein JST59_17980, partial [Actinobacteria bacterium]|nr:hypothetical protein [Actinomycetota bacterium]
MPVFPRKLRAAAAAGVLTVALALPIGVAAAAENKEPTHGATLGAPVENSPPAPAKEAAAPNESGSESGSEAAGTEAPPSTEGSKSADEGVTENAPLVPEAIRHPKLPPASGGTTAEEPGITNKTKGEEELAEAGTEEEADEAARRAGEEAGTNLPAPLLQIPSLTASACAATAVPPQLIPIYRRASAAYALGPQGPAVLAGINAVETGFG